MRIARFLCAVVLATCAFGAQAKMVHRTVAYTQDGVHFRSVLIYDDASTAKRPGLVMVPNWLLVTSVTPRLSAAPASGCGARV